MSIPKSIGIKLYDDTFVPVLTENEVKNKKITLTTVRDNQKKVIIELYEGTSNNCIHNEYLGKLTLPLDRVTGKGDPAFEVHLRLDEEGILFAKAWDTDTGEQAQIKIEHSQSHTISHEPLSDQQLDSLGEEEPDYTGTQKIVSFEDEEDYVQKEYDKKKGSDLLLKIILGLCVVVVIIAIVLLFRYCAPADSEQKPETQQTEQKTPEQDKASSEEEEQQKKLQQLEEEQKRKDEEAKKQREAEKQKQLAMEQQKEKERADELKRQQEEEAKRRAQEKEVLGMKRPDGKVHSIVYGDNLWNICKRYYGDPWYYPHLAEVNNLSNPRLILVGKTLIIPDKNDMRRWDFSR